MSGGVGPTEEHYDNHHQQVTNSPQTKKIKPFLTFRQLNSLAIMLVLASSGMVSLQDLGLVLFSSIYMFFLSKFSFPTKSSMQEQPVFNQRSKVLNLYVLFAAVVGLFLPILYIFEGILEGDTEGIKAAVPHVFLLASQVFMEGVSVWDRFSLPIRVFVPVFYNSVRMFTLIDWVKGELVKAGEGRRLYVGRGLAAANFVLWGFNLFCFLLPVYLPKALQRYYGGSSASKRD